MSNIESEKEEGKGRGKRPQSSSGFLDRVQNQRGRRILQEERGVEEKKEVEDTPSHSLRYPHYYYYLYYLLLKMYLKILLLQYQHFDYYYYYYC